MTTEKKSSAFKALVRGRVQGVFFRDFVYHHASGNDITGYVRNLQDGATVEVYAEGDLESLKGLIARLWEGPSGSRVASVEVQWPAPRGNYSGFDIVH